MKSHIDINALSLVGKVFGIATVYFLLIHNYSFAEQKSTTDDISLLNRYYYRLANRASCIDPGKRYTGNFKPISIRESVSLFENRKKLEFMEERTHPYYKVEEYEKESKGFIVRPIKELHAIGVYNEEEDAPLYASLGPQVDGNTYGALIGGGNAYLKDWISVSYNLRLSNDEIGGPMDFFTYKLKTGFRHVSVAAAKENVVVGPGFFGNLLASDNVEPENSVIIKTEVPYNWGLLGSFRWYLWHTWYDDDERQNKDPRLLGARISLMPWDILEIGLTRTAMYGGSENDSFNSLDAYWQMFTAENENDPGNKYNTDQNASLDMTLYLPFLNRFNPSYGGKVYFDSSFTDITATWQPEDKDSNHTFRPQSSSVLVGLLFTTGKTDIIVEYVRMSRNAYTGAGGFGEMGYSDNGYLIGHFAGSGAKGATAEVYHEWFAQLHVYIGFNYYDHENERVADEDLEFSHQIERGVFGGLRIFTDDSLQINRYGQFSKFSKTNTSTSPARYNFIDPDYSNTRVLLTLDYNF